MTGLGKVTVPEGKRGDWAVERFTIDKAGADLHNLRGAISGRARYVKFGEYTRLTQCGAVVMSDTDAELFDHWYAVDKAQGHCLIHGLGLGVVLQACLQKPEVTAVTVIEIAPEVIELVGSHYQGMAIRLRKPLAIIFADALTWKPKNGIRFGMVWHDIWPNICGDNLPEMKTLHRRYGRRCDWQGSWCRAECGRG